MNRNWAITIGINGYRNLQRLNFAKRDAEAMRDYFQQELDFQQIYHFSDDSPPTAQDYGDPFDSSPTYGMLRRFLRTRFEKPFLSPGDNLWFFFAGHGDRLDERDYLIPIDGDPGDLESTALPLHYVKERLRRCGADNVILLIDACRGRGRRDGLGIGEEKQQGVITLFSCSPRESSYEIEELQQGAFTHVLLESLRLEGEGNCATVERLYHRLRNRVPQISQHFSKPRQTPYGFIEPPTKYHLILLPKRANLADIVTLKNDALSAEVRKEHRIAKQLWIRVLTVSPADPAAIDAIERLALFSAQPQPVDAPSQSPSPQNSSGRDSIGASPIPQSPPSSTSTPPNPTFEFDIVTIDRVEKARILGMGGSRVVTTARRGKAEYFVEDLGEGVTLEMVKIPGGTFMMGAPEGEEESYDRERPQHQVSVPSFWMGKFAVTQAQWQRVAVLPKVERDLNSDPARFKSKNRPVETVNWWEAAEFCARLSKVNGREYRLPSEAEWEYACRAGTTTPFHFGETITTNLANYNGNSTYGPAPKGDCREETTNVWSFPPNAFGLYDMHGNVWEWCLDHWHDDYHNAPTDGSAWIEASADENVRRIIRGGSWRNSPRDCRSASRHFNRARVSIFYIGFRVVCRAPRALS